MGFGTDGEKKEIERHAIAVVHSGSGFLGVSIRDIDKEDVDALSLPAEKGAYIESVEEESPAEEAGLQEGDVVVEFDGEAVSSVRQFQRLVKETPPGRNVQLRVWRSGAPVLLSTEIGKRSGSYTWFGSEPEMLVKKKILPGLEKWDHHKFLYGGHDFHMALGKPRLGVQVAKLTDQMAEFLGIPGKQGVLILETVPSTPAEEAGLKAGDVILSVNGQEVSGPAELVKNLDDGENEIEYARERRISSITVNLSGSESGSDDALEM
jgi:S1-C subfamily serine protease